MASWSGFTEEDLHRLKRDAEINSIDKQKIRNGKQQRASADIVASKDQKKIRPVQQNRRKMPLVQEKDIHSKETEKDTGIAHDRNESMVAKTLNEGKEEDKTSHSSDADIKQGPSTILSTNKTDDGKKQEGPDLKPISDEGVVELELRNLEELQKRQKEIEEENKKKKQIINETISQRYKKAQHEASTLQSVQKELLKLDCLLAKDVEILRTKIEEATIAFSIAQKRYDKAEKEFVSAKLDLKVKSDIKEELTQHLYTIIQENELRKSKKLEELLSKLNATENTTAINCITDHVIEKEKL